MSQIVTTPDGQRHVFPDGATPAQIKAALASYGPPASPASSGYAPPQIRPPMSLAPLAARSAQLLPSAGGFVGGLAGGGEGPLSIGGASIGGGLGEGARQLLTGEPFSPAAIGIRGAEQGAYQAVGGTLAKGAGMLARPVMRRALGVGKTILSNFPDAVETALSKGIPVSEGGAAKAMALRRESSQALGDLLAKEGAGGRKFNTAAVAEPVLKLLKSNVLPKADKTRIAGQLVRFLDEQGAEVSPALLKQIKQFYQARASSAYRAGRAGALSIAQENRGLFSKALASGARQQLETIPGVAAREGQTQSLIGAERAVKEAVMRPPRPFEIHKPGTYPIANNPYVLSRVALTVNSPHFRALAKQSPRLAAAIVSQMIYTDQPDATSVYP